MEMDYKASYRTWGENKNWTESLTGSNTLTKTYLGIVKDSRDPQNMGRLLVWIPELSGDPNKEENWTICSYCSPFAGASFFDNSIHEDQGKSDQVKEQRTRGKGRTPELRDPPFYSGRQSYGMWFVPPDIGNEVLVLFLNGDPSKGVWFGCLFTQHMNHMVPGIASDTLYAGDDDISEDEQGPSIEHDPREGFKQKRKMYQPLRDGLRINQGLDNDAARGQSSSSAQRETPSQVFGILTPDGNSFVMDDNADLKSGGELIRLRTKSGAQLLIHETKGFIYMISKDGNTWIELSNEGNVDVYSKNNVSVHALTEDINLKSGRNINIQAKNDINIRADRNINIVSSEDTNINVNRHMKTTVGFDPAGIHGIDGTYDLHVKGDMFTQTEDKYDLLIANQLTSEVTDGPIHTTASSDIAINSGGDMGVTVEGDYREQAANVYMNSGAGVQPNPASNATDAAFPATHNPPGPPTKVTDSDPWTAGEEYADGTNIVERVPQHEPWKPHEVQTLGTSRHIPEGPPTDAKVGSTSADATAPNPVTTPDGKRLENGTYNSANLPEFPTVSDVDPACQAPPQNRQISEKGINVIKKFEGNKLEVYQDVVGLDTVGVGHLITDEEKASGEFSNGIISQEKADELLLQDLSSIQRQVRGCLTNNVTQEQYDALVSMAFNVGGGAFCRSTLVKKLNAGNYVEAPNEMSRWTKANVNGTLTPVQGLVNRRVAEANLFAEAPGKC